MRRMLCCTCLLLALQVYSQSNYGFQEYISKQKQCSRSAKDNSRFLDLGGGYGLSLPQQDFNKGMNPIHSLHASATLSFAPLPKNLQLGADMAYGIYSIKSFGINYQAGSNYINTEILYTSSALQTGLTAQYLLCSSERLQSYVSLKGGGLALFSSFVVEDPSDPFSCEAIDHDIFQGDMALYWGYGGGLRYALGQTKGARDFIDLSIHRIRGGRIEYVNMNKIQNQDKPVEISESGQPINTTFISNTNDAHQHTLAEVHSNPINMVQVRLSFISQIRLKGRK